MKIPVKLKLYIIKGKTV